MTEQPNQFKCHCCGDRLVLKTSCVNMRKIVRAQVHTVAKTGQTFEHELGYG